MYGQASPQPIVTTTSARSASPRVSGCGGRSERSMSTSPITSTASGCTRPCGSATLPADSAVCRPSAARANSASLICERPALCRQTKRTWLMSGSVQGWRARRRRRPRRPQAGVADAHSTVRERAAEQLRDDEPDAGAMAAKVSENMRPPLIAGLAKLVELLPLFDISRPTLSHHLEKLREAGIVDSERRGLWAYYDIEIIESHRVHAHAGSAIIRARSPT